jgi:ubiquinol-cytochrome c reductase cytochrome c1 subunit
MFSKFALAAVSALTLTAGSAFAAGETAAIPDVTFAHEGPFGRFDQFQLQRGLQVYTEVCASCHGLKFVPIRTLSDAGGPGLPEDQVRAYAEQFTITDRKPVRIAPACRPTTSRFREWRLRRTSA